MHHMYASHTPSMKYSLGLLGLLYVEYFNIVQINFFSGKYFFITLILEDFFQVYKQICCFKILICTDGFEHEMQIQCKTKGLPFALSLIAQRNTLFQVQFSFFNLSLPI